MMRRLFVTPVLLLYLAALPHITYALNGWDYFSLKTDPPGVEWRYHGAQGPEHWGELSAAFEKCSNGGAQSPVDISNPRIVRMPPLSFHYRANHVSMVNDGHTVRLEYEPGSYIRLGSHRYDLKEFHFHTPSEHTLYGKRLDMEIQLVHEDSAGNLAVVAIFAQGGRRNNNVLYRLVTRLPDRPEGRYYNRDMGINATFILPLRRDYLTYEGSLTTPPCAEGVRWIVLVNPLEVPQGYIQRLHAIMGDNNRPLQPLNNRSLLLER